MRFSHHFSILLHFFSLILPSHPPIDWYRLLVVGFPCLYVPRQPIIKENARLQRSIFFASSFTLCYVQCNLSSLSGVICVILKLTYIIYIFIILHNKLISFHFVSFPERCEYRYEIIPFAKMFLLKVIYLE